jgi:hypothetical protein
MRFSFVGIVLSLHLLSFVATQSPSIGSVDGELQHIRSVLSAKENIIIGMIKELQLRITATNETVVLSQIKTIIMELKELLTSLSTVSSYESYQSTVNCNDVPAKVSEVLFDIKYGLQINVDVLKNSTSFLIKLNNLNVAYVVNYHILTNDQKDKVQAVITSANILYNEYIQYNVALVGAIFKYQLVYINLLFLKVNLCSCPTELSTSSRSALSTVDFRFHINHCHH